MGRKLPVGWELIKLGHDEKYEKRDKKSKYKNGICDIKIGGTPSRSVSSYFGGDNIWVSVADLNGKELFDSKEKITNSGVEKSNVKLIKKGTTLVCFKLSLGKNAIAGVDLYTNEAIAGLEINKNFKDDYLNKYIFYYINSIDLAIYSSHSAKGNSINSEILNELPFLSIPKTDQQKIVGYLDKQFEFIDAMEKEVNTYEKKLDELEKGILEEAFSGFSEDEYKKLKDITINHDGKRIPLSANQRSMKKGVYPYYGASGIIDYIDEYIFEGRYLLISEDGANLLARTYPIAFIAQGKFWVNNHVHILTCIDGISFDNYLKYYFAFINISEYVTGSTQPKLNQEKLNSIKIPLPELSTQKSIAYKLDKQFELINSTRQEIINQKQNLKTLRKAMLHDIFGGFEE